MHKDLATNKTKEIFFKKKTFKYHVSRFTKPASNSRFPGICCPGLEFLSPEKTRTKVESDRLGRLKISYEKQVKEVSRGLAVCTLYTDSHCTI